jgi:hypothetical protein
MGCRLAVRRTLINASSKPAGSTATLALLSTSVGVGGPAQLAGDNVAEEVSKCVST